MKQIQLYNQGTALLTSWFKIGVSVLAFMFFSCKSNQNSDVGKISQTTPNIIIIYVDDLGYGDLGAFGATKLNTPNMDALANGGIRFTNGCSTSATCTPSRYALLTGMYPWRNKNAKILPGTAPLLIDTAQKTCQRC